MGHAKYFLTKNVYISSSLSPEMMLVPSYLFVVLPVVAWGRTRPVTLSTLVLFFSNPVCGFVSSSLSLPFVLFIWRRVSFPPCSCGGSS